MVVCKCRKATKLYCYVHTVPVCGECICSAEHGICVVRTYSDWVIDGEYEWPSKCSSCQEDLTNGEKPTTRLGCLHLLHTSCLEALLKNSAACPSCSLPLWPPPFFRDLGNGLPAILKEMISQAGKDEILQSNEASSSTLRSPPPAFSSLPLVVSVDDHKDLINGVDGISPELEISAAPPHTSSSSAAAAAAAASSSSAAAAASAVHNSIKAQQLQANSLARKSSYRSENLVSPYIEDGDEDDEGANRRKYSRRGPLYKQILRYLMPFRSPTLPISAPRMSEEYSPADSHSRRRHHHRRSSVDPRKILLFFAILSCVATMMLLYYRLIVSTA